MLLKTCTDISYRSRSMRRTKREA